jgi:hypothetical protein
VEGEMLVAIEVDRSYFLCMLGAMANERRS